MKKAVKNIMIGSLAFTAGVTLFNLVRSKAKKEKEIIVQTEEVERQYIDITEQLNQVREENKKLKENLEETNEKVKIYA